MHEAIAAGSGSDVHSVLRLIEWIYAAATGEVSWDKPVGETCRMGGFDACVLSSVDRLDRRPFVLSAHGRETFAGGVPGILPPHPLLTDSVLGSAPGAIWRDQEIVSPALLGTTSFWTEWMRPNRFVSWTSVIIGKRDEQVVCFEIYSRAPRASSSLEATRLITQLAPHLTRAWRVSEAIQQRSSAPAAAAGDHRSDEGEVAELNRLRAEFGLTRPEARLALALASGSSLGEAAELFGRKLSTIRSQLQQIFAKTGASRQAELVAMLLGPAHGRERGPHSVPHQGHGRTGALPGAAARGRVG